MEPLVAGAGNRPFGLVAPRIATLNVDRDWRLLLHAVAHALQPAVPPARHLMDTADGRDGREVREGMLPRTDQHAARRADFLEDAQCGRGVGVVPATDGEGRHLDCAQGNPAARPELGIGRRTVPVHEPGRVAAQTLMPDPRPTPLLVLHHGWQEVAGRHPGSPVDIRQQEPAAAMRPQQPFVVVVGCMDRDDRPQMRRLRRGDAERRDPAVGIPPDTDAPRAPGLNRHPLDDVVAVQPLLHVEGMRVLPLRRTGSPEVDLHDRVAAAREVTIVGFLDEADPAVLEIRIEREDARIPSVPLRKVEGGREADTVAHRDQDVADASNGEQVQVSRHAPGPSLLQSG